LYDGCQVKSCRTCKQLCDCCDLYYCKKHLKKCYECDTRYCIYDWSDIGGKCRNCNHRCMGGCEQIMRTKEMRICSHCGQDNICNKCGKKCKVCNTFCCSDCECTK
jgi:hypothetical protein